MFGSSQGFGFGGMATQEAATPAKAKRQEEKQTCLPVTVRMLDSAVAARSDESAEVLIHGSEAGIVHLVGVAEAVVQQTAMLEFQLNDASGRIKIRHYASGAGLAEGVASGRYVSVIGNLRTSPTVHLSAMSMRAVTSADEVSYHMIEVALATLKLRTPAVAGAFSAGSLSLKAGVAASDAGTPSPAKRAEQGISPVKVDAPMPMLSFEAAVPAAAAANTDVKSAVLAFLRQESENAGPEGLGFSSVVAKLAHCKASEVKSVLEGLVNEGEVFTTIDEEHFSLI